VVDRIIDREDPFAFDRFVQALADELQAEDGDTDPAKLERLIAHRLMQMNLTERELSEFTSRSRMVARAGRSVLGGLRRASDHMRGR
jgi:hypothetical protein